MSIHGAKSQGADSAINCVVVEWDDKPLSQHRFRVQRRAAMWEAKDAQLLKIKLEMGQLRYIVQSQAEELQTWRSWYRLVCSDEGTHPSEPNFILHTGQSTQCGAKSATAQVDRDFATFCLGSEDVNLGTPSP